MKTPKISGFAIFLPGALAIAALVSACGGSSQTSPTAEVPISIDIPSAADVAKQLNCGNFKDLGPSELGGVTSSGTCFIGTTKYAINTFPSMRAMKKWLELSEPFGLDVRWKTSTAVVYLSKHQPAVKTAAFSSSGAPLPKIAANTNGLHGQIRPSHVYIGQGSAPETRYLWWTRYSHTKAEASGWVWWPSVNASPRSVDVRLWRPVHYAGSSGKFFTRMSWTWRSTNGNTRTVLFWFVGQYPQWPFWMQQ